MYAQRVYDYFMVMDFHGSERNTVITKHSMVIKCHYVENFAVSRYSLRILSLGQFGRTIPNDIGVYPR